MGSEMCIRDRTLSGKRPRNRHPELQRTELVQDTKALMVQDTKALMVQDTKALMVQDTKALLVQDTKALMVQNTKALMMQDTKPSTQPPHPLGSRSPPVPLRLQFGVK